jgi:YD repeat-containing protein
LVCLLSCLYHIAICLSSPSGPLPTGIWQRDSGGSALYDYDPLYRLISATYSSGEVYTYTYDAVGNRLAMGADGELITYTYDIANRLTWVDDVEHTWDDGDRRSHGNLLDNGVFSYTYDRGGHQPPADQLVSVEDMTTTVVYTYNGDGHHVAKAVDGVTTIYVVAVLGLSQVLAGYLSASAASRCLRMVRS